MHTHREQPFATVYINSRKPNNGNAPRSTAKVPVYSWPHRQEPLVMCSGDACRGRVTAWWKKTTSGPGTTRPSPSNKNDPKDNLYKQVITIIIGGPPTGRAANNRKSNPNNTHTHVCTQTHTHSHMPSSWDPTSRMSESKQSKHRPRSSDKISCYNHSDICLCIKNKSKLI